MSNIWSLWACPIVCLFLLLPWSWWFVFAKGECLVVSDSGTYSLKLFVGNLWGHTWTFTPQEGFASLLSALLSLSTGPTLVHKVWLWFFGTYTVTSAPAARLHEGQPAVISQGRYFPFLCAESKFYQVSCVLFPFYTENRFLIRPNTKAVILGAQDLCRNLLLLKTEIWGPWLSYVSSGSHTSQDSRFYFFLFTGMSSFLANSVIHF